jgi:hypothetical protein
MNTGALTTRCVVPSRHGVVTLELHLRGGVDLHAFVRQRWPGDVAAQLLQPLAVVCFDPQRGVQTETLDVSRRLRA